MDFKSWSFKRKLAVILSLVLTIDLIVLTLIWQLNKSKDSPLGQLVARFTDPDRASSDKFSAKGNSNIVSSSSKKLESDPDNVNALSDRCEAYYYLGEYALAAKDAAHIRRLQPDDSIWVKWQAMAEKNYDPQQAIATYNQLIKLDGARDEYLLGRAYCFARVGQKQLCLRDLRSVKADPGTPATILERAKIYLQVGDSKQFIDDIVSCANTAGGDLGQRIVNNHCLYRYLLDQGRLPEAIKIQRQFIATLTGEYAQSANVERNQILGQQYKVLADLLLASGSKSEAMATYQKSYDYMLLANDDDQQVWERGGLLDFAELLQELHVAQLLKTPGLVDKTESHIVSKVKSILDKTEAPGYRNLLELIAALSRPRRIELCDATLQYLNRIKAQGDNFERDKVQLAILGDHLGEARRAITQIDPYAPGAMKNVELYLALEDPETALVVARGIKESRTDEDQMRAARAEFVNGDFEQAKEVCLKVKGDPAIQAEDIYTLSRLAVIQKDPIRGKHLARVAAGLGNQQALLDLLDTKHKPADGI